MFNFVSEKEIEKTFREVTGCEMREMAEEFGIPVEIMSEAVFMIAQDAVEAALSQAYLECVREESGEGVCAEAVKSLSAKHE